MMTAIVDLSTTIALEPAYINSSTFFLISHSIPFMDMVSSS